MNDDEALDKVRARMMQWQAYVAMPHATTSRGDTTGDERGPNTAREDPMGIGLGSTVISSIICARDETRSGSSAGMPAIQHPFVQLDHSRDSHSWSDLTHLPTGGALRERSGSESSLGAAVADPSPDGVDHRLIGLQESLQHEREQSRRLTEAVAREQLLQAYALRAATDPRTSSRQTNTPTPGPASWQRRERIRRDWCLVIAWILLLLAGIVVMVALSYGS